MWKCITSKSSARGEHLLHHRDVRRHRVRASVQAQRRRARTAPARRAWSSRRSRTASRRGPGRPAPRSGNGTTRSVPPYSFGGTLSCKGDISAIRMAGLLRSLPQPNHDPERGDGTAPQLVKPAPAPRLKAGPAGGLEVGDGQAVGGRRSAGCALRARGAAAGRPRARRGANAAPSSLLRGLRGRSGGSSASPGFFFSTGSGWPVMRAASSRAVLTTSPRASM